MAKLNLVIADTDHAYVENLSNFILCHYANRFYVSYYTQQTSFNNFLTENTKQIDILLINPELYSPTIQQDNIKTCIILAAGNLVAELDGCEYINKYQHGEKLVNSIINIFVEKDQNEVLITAGNKQTKIVGVYSPIGGAGKTTTAAGMSIVAASRGLSIFYLNLENIHSTSWLFKGNNEQNLSHIFYHLKEKNKNLILKIEGCRTCDDTTGVHYFMPPDSAAEMDEMLPEELQQLIYQFKIMKQYNIVFIDMSSSFDQRNIAIMKECDEIIVVATADNLGQNKMNSFIKEIDILSNCYDIDFNSKMIFVLNKCSDDMATRAMELKYGGHQIAGRIPVKTALGMAQSTDTYMDMNSLLGRTLSELIDRFI